MSGLEILAIVIGLAALGLLLKQIHTLNQKIQKIQAKAASLEDENSRLWTTQSELSTEAKRLQGKVDNLTDENQTLKSQLKEAQEINEIVIADLALASQNSDLQRQQEQIKKAIIDTENQKIALEIERDQLRQSVALWQEEYQKISAEHDEIIDRDQKLKDYPELLNKQEELIHQIDDIEQERVALSVQISQIQAQLERDLQGIYRIKIISACHQHSTSDQELFHAKITMGFNRVREALDFAETMFGDVLEVWDSARTSADASNFIRPDDAYRALQSLAWFGQYYFEQDGAIGNTIYQVLRERYNLECTPEAKNVLNNKKLRDERCFWHGSQRKEMFDHLKLGGGNGMNNILRIYFAINSESQKIEIGHCGRHP